ncbi:MAG: molybdopterin containing oxidoreductase [Litorilinea sp.]|nr:MAG: molybdopterin containing oxidoreductase [Litorilinea sp.]
MSKQNLYQHDPAIAIITGACPHDCPDTCSWQVAVERQSGRAVDLWGHPHHPVTAGRLCAKVDRYLERTYHPERLTTPLRRVGPKGSGQFVPISWDEALGAIAARLQEIIATVGPEAVLPYSYAGTMGYLQGEGMAKRFFHRMGASQLARTICSEAGFEGYVATIGATEGLEPQAFAHARLILIWGSNTLTSNAHLWPFIQAARHQGARVIVIDPARTRTARAADEWIPIRPGTDGALALALMHVIVAEGLYDADYVARHTLGFDALAQRVAEWTPERAAELTGVPAERIRTLAREYATTRPAAIRINYGMQRHAGGGMAVRTIACLPALVGAWREVGGGIQLSSSGAFRHLDTTCLYRPDLLQGRTPRTINMNRLGDALSLDPAIRARAHYHPRPVDPVPTPAEAGPPVMALIVYNANPAAVCPDQEAVLRGLQREDLFTVVLEHFQTDTADYADYVLPATTQLEHWDLIKPYGHLYLALNRPAIEPVGQSLPNSEIFRRLAGAMGYREPCFAQGDEEILQELIAAQRHPRFATVTWEALLERGFVRLNLPEPYLPFAEGNFPTPSGKCEFYSQRLADAGYDPLPTYTPPAWQQQAAEQGDPTAHPPLTCISPPAHSFLNSTFVNVERLRRREGVPTLQIHPDDAAPRQVVDGAPVTVWNQRGRLTLRAVVTADIVPGTVLVPGIWWAKLSPDGRNVNQLTAQDEADMGAGATFYDVLVWVAPAVDLNPAAAEARGAMAVAG